MQTVEVALKLLKRQAELEAAMRKTGGIHITEEQELHALRKQITLYPQAIEAVMQASHALRRPVTAISAPEVESWANVRAGL